MRITMTGKNMQISDGLKDRIDKQIRKLDKFLHDDADVQVKLTPEKGTRNTAEITIIFDGTILRAEETTPDMYASIDLVTDKIVRQIRRHRTKLEKRLRVGAFDSPVPEDAEPVEALSATEPVRVKRFTVKPMSTEDAIAQMDMLGHSFFLFLNDETNSACVVYRREDGGYGLLAPDNM